MTGLKEITDLIKIVEVIKPFDLTIMYNLGYETAQITAEDNGVYPISPQQLKDLQAKLAILLKGIANFQSGFSRGFEKSQDEAITKKYYEEQL